MEGVEVTAGIADLSTFLAIAMEDAAELVAIVMRIKDEERIQRKRGGYQWRWVSRKEGLKITSSEMNSWDQSYYDTCMNDSPI